MIFFLNEKNQSFRLISIYQSSNSSNRFVNGAGEGTWTTKSLNNQERIVLEYYVVYDFNDNIIAYCNDLDELSIFVNRRKKELKYRFKNKDIFYVQVPKILKIYKFNWGGRTSIFCMLFFIMKGECNKWESLKLH